MRPRAVAFATWSLAVLLIASIVHLSSILLLPVVADQDSYARLARLNPTSGFRILASDATDAGALPFTDPAVTLAVCRYDLSSGPWRVRVDTDPEALTSMSFYGRKGTVFHTLTDRAALRGRLDVFLGTAGQIDAAEAADTEETTVREVRLTAPTAVGFILMRGMAPNSLGKAALMRRLDAAECRALG